MIICKKVTIVNIVTVATVLSLFYRGKCGYLYRSDHNDCSDCSDCSHSILKKKVWLSVEK